MASHSERMARLHRRPMYLKIAEKIIKELDSTEEPLLPESRVPCTADLIEDAIEEFLQEIIDNFTNWAPTWSRA